ncbi:hypothetical protein [Methylomicrobium lacus]|uniref:hypothetical protein n=1 Tax=Methylomicrobium lacus TaxID=136992 RepID=UPI0035A82F5E
MSNQSSTDRQQFDEYLDLKESSQNSLNQRRMFRTALPASYFVRLEYEAVKRGTTSFKFAGMILMAYLDKNCPLKSS